MTLAQLFFEWPEIQKHFSSEMTVLGLATDTRKLSPGSVFVAIQGTRQDGHDHLDEAVRRGALALVVQERYGVEYQSRTSLSLTVLICTRHSRPYVYQA